MKNTKYIEKSLETFNRVKIFYNLLGLNQTQKKQTLVFLHGLGGDLKAWDDIRELFLEKGFGSVAVDIRGHGLSSRPRKNDQYDFDLLAEDVIKIIKKEKLDNLILVGHCMGGMVAQKIAVKNIPQVKKIVLISTSCNPFKILKKVGISSAIEKLAKLFENYFSQLNKDGRITHRDYYGTGDFNLLRIVNDLKHTSLNSYGHVFSKIHAFDLSEELKKVKRDVLVIVGANDKIFSKNSSRKIHRLVPNSKIKVVDGADHMMIFNHPEKIVEYILGFIYEAK